MRRICRALWLVGWVLLAAGCTGGVSLDQRALVGAIGIDATSTGIRVYLEIVIPSRATPGVQSGGVSTIVPNHFVITGDGIDVAQAIEDARAKISRRFYFGANVIVIIGAEAAKRGIAPIIDFLGHSRGIRNDVNMALSEQDLGEFLQTELATSQAAPLDWNALLSGGAVPAVSINRLANALVGSGIDPFLPIVEAASLPKSPGPGSGPTAISLPGTPQPGLSVIKGVALFRGAHYAGSLPYDDLWAFDALARSPQERAVITLRLAAVCPSGCRRGPEDVAQSDLSEGPAQRGPGGTTLDLALRGGRLTFEVTAAQGVLSAALRFRPGADVVANGAALDLRDSGVLKRVNRAASELVAARLEAVIAKTLRLGVDPFGFGQRLARRHPSAWRALAGDWHARLSSLQPSVTADVKVVHTGLAIRPFGFPAQDLLR